MSIKAFHYLFLALSILLAAGTAAWAVLQYRATGDEANLAWAVVWLIGAAALLVYARHVVRKLKRFSYL